MENIKIYKQDKKVSVNTISNKTFNLYPIVANVDKIKIFKEEYLKTINGEITYKILCTHPEWFYFDKGIYDLDKAVKNRFCEFSLLPVCGHYKLVNDYVSYGAQDSEFLKALRFSGKNIFIYTKSDIAKRGRVYSVTPVIKINEDLYNIEMINLRNFSSVTTRDLSRYSDFFTVLDEPYQIIEEARIEDLYRTGKISLKQYKEQVKSYENEEILVKTLRK